MKKKKEDFEFSQNIFTIFNPRDVNCEQGWSKEKRRNLQGKKKKKRERETMWSQSN